MLTPIIHLPKHPVRLARFGIPAAAPASVLARSWSTPQGRALFGGVAAHAFAPLTRPMSSSVGCALIDACHAFGWPAAKGGSQAIPDALASILREHGGRIETGRRVSSYDEVAGADLVVFDLAPSAVAEIVGDRLPDAGRPLLSPLPARPRRVQARSGDRGRGPMDQRVVPAGGDRPRRRHLRGDRAGRAGHQPRRDARAPLHPGRPAVPRRPEPLEREPHPLYLYAHVPNGYTGDATESMLGQIERFAPGFASGSSRPRSGPRPTSRRTTRTTSAATSSPEPTARFRY